MGGHSSAWKGGLHELSCMKVRVTVNCGRTRRNQTCLAAH